MPFRPDVNQQLNIDGVSYYIARQADEEARAATGAIPDPGEGGSMGSGSSVF